MAMRSATLKPALWIVYLAVGLEFLFMISPFALYFYSSYGPLLNLLHRSPSTAWLTGFFLPHVSVTGNPLIDSLKPAGFRIAACGLILFVVSAIQVYGAKLLRRGAVTGGIYRISRHPQYASLAILGFGILLVWPRFLVLVAYVTMLFLYLLLARSEERHCLERFGDAYREYMLRVGFFLPRSATAWLPAAPWRWRPGAPALVAAYLLTLGLSIAAALVLRDISLGHVSSFYEGRTAVLSPAPLAADELGAAYRLASSEATVEGVLAEAAESPSIVYVVPSDWYLPDLPLDRWEEIPAEDRRGHTTPRDFDRSRYKVLFTRALTHFPDSRGPAIVKRAHGREALARVPVDLERSASGAAETPPRHVVWGNIPTPLF